MAKIKELGVVSKIHSSGIVETDKGIRSNLDAKTGDRLVKNLETNKVEIAAKKTKETAAQRKARLKAEAEAKAAEEETQETAEDETSDLIEDNGEQPGENE